VTSGQLSGNGRGPRRAERVTYRVRVDLKETKPLTWRRLDLASDLNLAEVHDILQAAFGWTDSHLHGFAAGPEFLQRGS
jgi:pRiA4b ORF-3-like protein